MNRWFDLLVFVLIVMVDRGTKLLVPGILSLYESIEVIPGFFSITYVRNTGGAFGMLAGWDSPLRRIFFVVASLAALALLTYLYKQALISGAAGVRLSLVAIGGGAVGNLYDRLTLGEVVDFLEFYLGPYHWPTFNVADSAITVGAVTLLLYYWTGRGDLPGPAEEVNSDAA